MGAEAARGRKRRYGPLAAARAAIAVVVLSIVGTGVASAYIGPSFLEVPGISGGWQGKKYKNWIRIDASYWGTTSSGFGGSAREPIGENRAVFSGPLAPRQGAGRLAFSIDKHNPVLSVLMDRCLMKEKIPELSYSESSELARPPRELGLRPAAIPEYFEYKLTDVAVSCPVVEAAPEQAFIFEFTAIRWLNYQGKDREVASLVPAKLPRAQTSGATKTFVLTWIAGAVDGSEGQCTAPVSKPTEEDYYALRSKEDADKERAERAAKGGVAAIALGGQMAYRGPDKLNVCRLPGIVPDPGHPAPQTNTGRGFNLDGDDGTGNPPASTRKHKNYVSADGQTGIDNQLMTVTGCIPGFRRNGLLSMTSNEGRRSGLLSILVVVSGIDNEQNDNSVDVTLLYSKNPMVKNAAGSQILPDYTFAASEKPEFTQNFARLHGRIVNGVVITEAIKRLPIDEGGEQRIALTDARIRLQFMPDGTMKGIVGGYQDWRELANFWAAAGGGFEAGMGYECPGVYNALKRAADGLKDPVTGEYNGISEAFDIEGVPAFIPPEQRTTLLARTR
jgi:type VI protein secretion system component Hcp